MFRSLIASIIAFAIAVTVVVNPAYAESTDTNYYFNNSGGSGNGNSVIIGGHDNTIIINNPSNRDSDSEKKEPDSANTFVNGLWKGVVETA